MLVKIITDTSVDASKEMKRVGAGTDLSEEERCDVLALRGLLACRILEHSLQMRHLVDYGVNRFVCRTLSDQLVCSWTCCGQNDRT